MKVGCVGCLVLIVVCLFLAALAGGFLFLSGNIFEPPPFDPVEWSGAEAYPAQNKLYEIVQRDNGSTTRQDPIVLTEREVSALLQRILADSARLRFEPFAVRLGGGQFVLKGQTRLGSLLQGPGFAQLAAYIPPAQLNRPIWITARGYVSIERGQPGIRPGIGRVVLTEFELGRQPVGAWPFPLVMGRAGSRLLRWSVPGILRDVEIEDRRIVIRTG